MEHYVKYKMGYNQKTLLKDRVLPSKLDFHEDCRKWLCDATSQTSCQKRRKLYFIMGNFSLGKL